LWYRSDGRFVLDRVKIFNSDTNKFTFKSDVHSSSIIPMLIYLDVAQ